MFLVAAHVFNVFECLNTKVPMNHISAENTVTTMPLFMALLLWENRLVKETRVFPVVPCFLCCFSLSYFCQYIFDLEAVPQFFGFAFPSVIEYCYKFGGYNYGRPYVVMGRPLCFTLVIYYLFIFVL